MLINYGSEPANSDPIVLMQIRDTGCCNFKLFTRKRNDTRTTTVGMLITKADAGRLSTTQHGDTADTGNKGSVGVWMDSRNRIKEVAFILHKCYNAVDRSWNSSLLCRPRPFFTGFISNINKYSCLYPLCVFCSFDDRTHSIV